MAIRIKTDLDWGNTFYLKDDIDQLPHSLVSIRVMPGNQLKFELSHQGEVTEVWDFEATQEYDKIKALNADTKDEDD